MIEKERKYLPDLSKTPPPIRSHFIKQAYIISCRYCHIRVRIIDNTEAFLTFKSKVYGKDKRKEYECSIDLSFGNLLYKKCKQRLEKVRHYLLENEKEEIILDEYSDGTCIIEIEYKDELIIPPEYCVEDVTNNDYYYNQNIVKRIKTT